LFEVDRSKTSNESRRASGKKQATVTRTFRIRAEYDDFLRNEAERQGVSVNVYLNLILRKRASFDCLSRGYNVISLTKQAFRQILEYISLEHLAHGGEKSGAKDCQNILDIIGIPSNYDSFKYLVTRHFGSPDGAMWFTCYHHFHKNSDVFHLQHDLGRGWSVYLQNYFLSYLKTLKIDCETKVYDYAVNIRVPRLC
jgi:hypothetical protein